MSLSLYENPLEYIDYQLSRVFGDQGMAPAKHNTRRGPRMDLIEKKEEYVASFEIPGMSREEIKVAIHNNVLTVSGENKRQQKYEQDKYRYSERLYGQFSRSITLPQGIDVDKVCAKYENGLLHVVVPKCEAACTRKIPIN